MGVVVKLLSCGLWELNILTQMEVQTKRSSLASLSSHSWSRRQFVFQCTPHHLPIHRSGLGCASCRGYGLRKLRSCLKEFREK